MILLKPKLASTGRALAAAAVMVLCLAAWRAGAARRAHLVLYFPKSSGVIPLNQIKGVSYFPILQLLNLAGSVRGLQEERKKLTIWFGNTRIELRSNDRTLRLNEVKLKLSQPIRVLRGEWQAPTDFLNAVLPTLTNQPVTFDPRGNRAFIGNVQPNTFSVRVNPIAEGAQLTVEFAEPVRIRTAASNGRWIIYLGDHPVEPLEPIYQFHNPFLTALQFDDQDGVPKLILTPTSAALNFYPSLTEGGKALVADVTKPGAPAAPAPSLQAPAFTPALPPAPSNAPPALPPVRSPPASTQNTVLPAVVLDAGHGGDNLGARGPDGLAEKDLVAALVARVRMRVLSSGGDRVILTRLGDTDPSFEERAATANIAHPVAFLSFHAGDLGATSPRILVYTYQATAPISIPSPNSLFIPWNEAQQPFLSRSQRLAELISNELGKLQGVSTAPPQSAPVRALRSIAAPAVAIELGSLNPTTDASKLTDPGFQQQIAAAVARAISAFQSGQGMP